jgi:hypothetical protein
VPRLVAVPVLDLGRVRATHLVQFRALPSLWIGGDMTMFRAPT